MSNTKVVRLMAAAAITLGLSGCLAYGGPWMEPVGHGYGETPYRIPPGHMPPPGECRIWFPDRPPGQQPPPGNCYDLQRRVPPGAVLVRG